MKITILGESFYAWVAAVQMASLGHQITLCPDEHTLVTEPDTELQRESGLMTALRDQVRSGRLCFGLGADMALQESGPQAALRPAPEQIWIAQSRLSVAALQASLATMHALRDDRQGPAICVLTPYPVGTLANLQACAGDTLVYSLSLFVRGGRWDETAHAARSRAQADYNPAAAVMAKQSRSTPNLSAQTTTRNTPKYRRHRPAN